jgi:hypothetical protein
MRKPTKIVITLQHGTPIDTFRVRSCCWITTTESSFALLDVQYQRSVGSRLSWLAGVIQRAL